MGLFDNIKSTVVTKFKADIGDHKRKLKELSSEEQKRHKTMIKGLEEQNKKIDAQVLALGKAAIAITGTILALKAAHKSFMQDAALRTAAAGVDLDTIKKASRGLISELDQLKIAASLNNGAFKLNNEQVKTAVEGMLALRKQGNDFVRVQAQVTKSLVEANGGPLAEFGAINRETAGTLENVNKTLDLMKTSINQVGGEFGRAGDDMERTSIKLDNSVERIKVSFGKIADGLAPVVAAVAEVVEQIAKVFEFYKNPDLAGVKQSPDDHERGSFVMPFAQSGGRDARIELATERKHLARAQARFLKEQSKESFDFFNMTQRQVELLNIVGYTSQEVARLEDFVDKVFAQRLEDLVPLPEEPKDLEARRRMGLDRAAKTGKAPKIKAPKQPELPDVSFLTDLQIPTGGSAELGGMQIRGPEAEKRKTIFEAAFGDVETIGLYEAKILGLRTATNLFADASVAMMDAWITGDMTIGEALERQLGSSLRALALEMQVNAAKEAAYGLASLAGLNPAKAGAHFAAAAGFQVAAIAAGAASRELGAGQARTVTPSAPPNVNTPQARGGTQESKRTIIVGADFAGQSHRERRARLRRILEEAEQDAGSGSAVEFA